MQQETITATCLVFPDGTTFWFEGQDSNMNYRLIEAWKARLEPERLRLYHDTAVLGGIVLTRMLREDYLRIPVTSQSAELAAVVGLGA